jgi:hypothetical protein
MSRFVFGGDPRRFSEMFDFMNEHLYRNFYNKISGTSMSQWIPKYVHRCRYLIHRALSDTALFETEHLNGEIVGQAWVHQHFDYETFRVFGFIDDFAMKTARPADVNATLGIILDLQRSVYSGYQRTHGFKAQVVTLPIGIIGCVFITEVRQNDNGVQNISGLSDYLWHLLGGIIVGGLHPCLYGDTIFAVLACIVPRIRRPTDDVAKFINRRMSSLRQMCEHINSDHETYFQLFGVPKYLRIYKKGPQVRKLCLNSFFVQNCYYCIHGNRSRTFGQVPPTLEDYIPLDEVILPPPSVNLGEIWDL